MKSIEGTQELQGRHTCDRHASLDTSASLEKWVIFNLFARARIHFPIRRNVPVTRRRLQRACTSDARTIVTDVRFIVLVGEGEEEEEDLFN